MKFRQQLLSFYKVKKIDKIDMEDWIKMSKGSPKDEIPYFLRYQMPMDFLHKYIRHLDLEELCLNREIDCALIFDKYFDEIKDFLPFINWTLFKQKNISFSEDLLKKYTEFYFEKNNDSWFDFLLSTQNFSENFILKTLLKDLKRTKRILKFKKNIENNLKLTKNKKEIILEILDKLK